MKQLKVLLMVLLLFAFIPNLIFGQKLKTINGNKTEFISLNSKSRNVLESSKFQENYYVVIWLDDEASYSDIKRINSSNVKLHKSAGENLYWASVNEKGFETLIKSGIVHGVAGSAIISKHEKDLQGFNYPEYVFVDDDQVKIILTYFGSISDEDILTELNRYGCNGVKIRKHFSRIDCVVPKNKVRALSSIPWVASINAGGRIMEAYENAGNVRHGLGLFDYYHPDYKLTGKGVNIGVWDGDTEEHMDLKNRIHIQELRIPGSDHGIHVSGIVAGNGLINPKGKGAAPEANLYTYNYDAADYDEDLVGEEMLEAAENFDISITSNSYGLMNLGANIIPYMVTDANLDIVANRHPNLLHVFAVGNNKLYFDYHTATTSAKNIVQVANIDLEGYRNSSSSFGPTAGGHLIPHVAAYGTGVLSTSYQNSYAIKTGTSMSAPLVSGSAAQMVQFYREKFNEEPPAVLLKGLICNTASDIDLDGPDYQSGYGIFNHYKALEALNNEQFILSQVEDNYTTEHHINVPAGTKEFRVMVVWNDPWAYPTMDNPLVNNLDVVIKKDGEKYYPWVLDPTNPSQPATRGKNNLDNMEQVLINDPEPGLYTIEIDGRGIVFDAENKFQDYALVYEFIKPELILFSPVTEDVLEFQQNIFTEEVCQINWFAYGSDEYIKVELSKDGGQTFTELDEVHPKDVFYEIPLPENFDYNYQVRLKQGGIYSESKVIKAMRAPELTIDRTSENQAMVWWNKSEGATEYLLFEINNGELIETGSTTDTSFTISTSTGSEIYYAVQAVNSDLNLKSVRSQGVKPDLRLNVATLPFYVDFEENGLEFFAEDAGYATLRRETENNNTSILLLGNSNVGPKDYDNENENRFSDYEIYVSSLTSGKISIPENKNTILSLDVLIEKTMKFTGESSRVLIPYFRVKANGDSIPEINGYYDAGGEDFEMSYPGTMNPEYSKTGLFFPFKTLYYDLSAYAGQDVELAFESLLPYASKVKIDNISIYEAFNTDIALIGKEQIASAINLTAQNVTVQVANFGTSTLQNIDLSYQINRGFDIDKQTETFSVNLEPFSSTWVTFSQQASFANQDITNSVEIMVASNDDNPINNSVIINNIDNYRTQVPLKYKNETVIVDTAIYLTDQGGDRYINDYLTGQMNFIPANPDKVLMLEFEEFDIRYGDDFRVYSGVFGTDGLIDTMKLVHFTVPVENPANITSISPTGGFLIHWRGWAVENGTGWKIKVSQVDPEVLIDGRIKGILSPITHTDLMQPVQVKAELWNFGRQNIESMVVSYQIDAFPEVFDTLTFENGLKANERFIHTFDELADLTEFGKMYTLKSRIYLDGDEHEASNLITERIKNTYPLVQFDFAPRVYLYNMYFNDEFYQAPWWYSYDNSRIFFDVEYNKTYTVDMLIGGSAAMYEQEYFVEIQVDWNNDGDFNDFNEIINAPTVDIEHGQNTGYLTVPNNAVAGIHRMRINTYTYSINGELRQGNQTDFSLKLSGTPVAYDVAFIDNNIINYSDPFTYIPEFDIKQIGLNNDSILVELSIGENYKQVSSTILNVSEERKFVFPAVNLDTGIHELNISVSDQNDATPDNNRINEKISVYAFKQSFMPSEKGIAHFDINNLKMNVLRVESTNVDSLAYFFGTYARDSFYVYKREIVENYHSVALMRFDTLLQTEDTVYDYSYHFNDILGVAYADNTDDLYTITSLTRNRESYVTQQYDLVNNEINSLDTVQANGHYLKNLAGLTSDTEGNLFTIYKPQSVLGYIEKGSGELLGMAIIPENMMEATDISIEMDKNTGNFMVTVDKKMYRIKPMNRMAELVGSSPESAWGMGLPYTIEEASKVAALRVLRFLGQTKASSINETTKTIEFEMPYDADLTQIVPDFITVNGGTMSINGVTVIAKQTKIDISQPASMVITSADGEKTQTWTLKATKRSKTELLSFKLLAENNQGLVDNIEAKIVDNTILIDIPSEVEISKLVASFDLSAATALYNAENRLVSNITEVDYRSDLILTAMSSDGIDQVNYLVRINRGVNSQAYINSFELLLADNSTLAADYIAEIVGNDMYLGFEDTTMRFYAVPQISHPAGSNVYSNTGLVESGIGSAEIFEGAQFVVKSEDQTQQNVYNIKMGEIVGLSHDALSAINCFPNPANNRLTITNAQNTSLRVTNIVGQVVLQTNLLVQEQSINVSHLQNGIYLFELTNNNQQRIIKIIIEK